MRLHWPGVYGFGMVLSMIGMIWFRGYTWQFFLTLLVCAIAGLISMVVKGEDDPLPWAAPQTLYDSQSDE